MSLQKSWREKFAGTMDGISTAAQWLDDIMAGQNLPEETSFAAQLCLEELFANTFRHGRSGTPGNADNVPLPLSIEVNVTIDKHLMRMTFEDNGKPFDVTAAPARAIDRPIAEVEPGGLGILLLRNFASSLKYERAGLGNRVTVEFVR